MGMFGSYNVKTGNGKTVATAAIASDYDDKFDVDSFAVSPAQLLQQLAKVDKAKGYGRVIVCEEAQNYASNRTWFSIYNKTIMHTIATCRFIRAIVIFITPMARMIDSDVQKLMRFKATPRLLKDERGSLHSYVRFREVYTYEQDKHMGEKPIKFYNPETGDVIEMDELEVFINKPDLIEAIEDKITAYKREFQGDILEDVLAFEEAEKQMYRNKKVLNPKEMALKMLEDSYVQKELSNKGTIQSGSVAAFYPNLSQQKDISAVHWWTKRLWEDLQMVKQK